MRNTGKPGRYILRRSFAPGCLPPHYYSYRPIFPIWGSSCRRCAIAVVGDKEEFKEVREWITGKIELSDRRLQLLRSGGKTTPLLGKLGVRCHNVGEGHLEQKIAEGCNDLASLCSASGAGTGCGSCRSEVKRILEAATPGAGK